ncbi:MAG TPA: winged helix-turn-helix transcriptional regulator [Caulobacteraceae bacterium]|jgi:predicted ArsR family transcriptional regulator
MPAPFEMSIEQVKLISFGPRRDIIAVLANEPDLSAREIAERLDRGVTALYRHLDALVDSRLIHQSGSRPGSKRPHALYALAARLYSARTATETAEGRAAFAQAATRYAAAASRKFSRAMRDGTARPFAEDANVSLNNVDLQLDRASLIELQKLLQDFLAQARKLRVRGEAGLEPVTLTVLIAPTR